MARVSVILVLCLIAGAIAEENSNEAIRDYRVGYNLFSGELYTELTKTLKRDNSILSPFSASNILALLRAGSRGETAQELRQRLHLTEDNSTALAFRSLLPVLRASTPLIFRTANRLYVSQDLKLNETFARVGAEVFGAGAQNLNFGDIAGSVKSVNEWVSTQTNGTIKELLAASDIDAQTKLLLVNALELQGNFTIPFRPNATKKANFYVRAVTTRQVDTLQNLEGYEFDYYESSVLDAQVVELELASRINAALGIVRPNKVDGLSYILQNIRKVAGMRPPFVKVPLAITLPKFTVENKVDLKQLLINLGIRKAFDQSQADFSAISGKKGELFVQNVVQKSFVNLNENGIRAGAATDATLGIRVKPNPDPSKRKQFIVDRPFLFYIRILDFVLFGGSVSDPTAK